MACPLEGLVRREAPRSGIALIYWASQHSYMARCSYQALGPSHDRVAYIALLILQAPPPPPPPRPIEVEKRRAGGPKKHAPLLGAVGISIVLGLVIHACVADQKKKEIKSASAKLDDFTRDWIADLEIASATSRIALAGPVMKLREREEQLAKAKAPECLAKIKSELMAHVRASIEAFTSFMADQEYLSTYHTSEASKHLVSYGKSKAKCEASLK